jgi:transposase
MEGWTTIRYLQAEGKSIHAIAKELGVTRKVVRRALASPEEQPRYQRAKRSNPKIEPYTAQIRELHFSKQLIGTRILREIQAKGYSGGRTALYVYLDSLKQPQLSGKVTMRFETEPGQQAQFDWSPYTIELGGELRRVVVYGMTLGFSRRKHYTASLDERQGSIFEGIEACLWHFGGSAKELLVDNPKSFVLDARPAHFRWNPQFLELCGHYGIKPRACVPYRPRTKGKVERPFFYLEQQFIKGTAFKSLAHFLDELAIFERDDLDVRVHETTQQPPLERFALEQPQLTPLPERRFVGSTTETRKVSWDCLVSYKSNRYSVPSTYAGKMVWLLLSHGTHLLVLSSRRELLVEHELRTGHGEIVMLPEHYAPLRRRGTPRTYVVLAEAFLARFPHHADFLEGLTAQYKLNPVAPLRAVMELAALYPEASLRWAFTVAVEYNSYSHTFVRGLLESGAVPQPATLEVLTPLPGLPATTVECDLRLYQQVLVECAR